MGLNGDGQMATEDRALENMGYQPELQRSFGLLGMIGFSFSIVTSWSALGGVLVSGEFLRPREQNIPL